MAAYCPAGCYCRGEGTECPLFTGAFNNWCGQECSCPQGFYCEFNEFPKACRHGYYTECQTIGGTPGAGSMDECIPCPAGTAVNLATPGYAGPENCVNCQPGSFSPNEGATSCEPCDAGFYCPNAKMTAKLNCPEGFYCPLSSIAPIKCLESQSCPPNSAAPDICPPGFVCNSGGSFPCTEGSYCPGGSLFPIICPAGSYCPPQCSEPIPCPDGTYSDNLGLISEFLCVPCPNGFVCPPGSTKYYRQGLTKGELAASIVVPVLGILILIILFYFCCWRTKKKSKKATAYNQAPNKPDITHPVKAMQPVTITKSRYISSSASSTSTEFPPLPRHVIEAQESFDKTEKEYAQRFAPEYSAVYEPGSSVEPNDIAISMDAPIVAVSTLQVTEEIQMPVVSKWESSTSSSDTQDFKKTKKKKKKSKKSSSGDSDPSGMKPFSYINPKTTIRRKTLKKHASQRKGIENKAFSSNSSSESDDPPIAQLPSFPHSTSMKENTGTDIITLPVAWVESSSSSSSSTPTTPRAKLEAPPDVVNAIAELTIKAPNFDFDNHSLHKETDEQKSSKKSNDNCLNENNCDATTQKHMKVAATFSKATTAKPSSLSRSTRSSLSSSRSSTCSSSSASEEDVPDKSSQKIAYRMTKPDELINEREQITMPLDCYKSSSSSSSSSASDSSASAKNEPAKNPDGRIPRGGSVNLSGIRDGIEGIGDAIDRLRRRVRGGKCTDNEVIDSGKSEKSGSISSKSSVSAEVTPDALTDERVFNKKNIPFTMISIEEAAKKAILSPRSQANLDAIQKNLSDSSECGSGGNLPILSVPFEIKKDNDSATSTLTFSSSSSGSESGDQQTPEKDYVFQANPNHAIKNKPTHAEFDFKAFSTLKEKERRHSSTDLNSTDDTSCNEDSEFKISVTNEIKSPDASIISGPLKKMTDALISRWTSQSSISMSDTASEVHRSNDTINDVLKRWSRPSSVSEIVAEKIEVSNIEDTRSEKLPLDKTNSLNYTANWSVPRRFKFFNGTINSDTTSENDFRRTRSRSESSSASSKASSSNRKNSQYSRVIRIRSSSEETVVAEKYGNFEKNNQDIERWEDILAEPAVNLIRIPKYSHDKIEYVRDILRKHNHIPQTQTSVRYDKTTTESETSSSSSNADDEQLRQIDMLL